MERPRGLRSVVVVCLAAVLSEPPTMSVVAADTAAWLDSAAAGQTGVTRIVAASTSTGRRGTYYLPRDYDAGALPLLVLFHGTGGKGSLMVLRLQALAERQRFVVLAPDSVNVSGVWIMGQSPDETTEDLRHIMQCIREVLTAPGVRIDRGRVLAAGFSVGANAAFSVASRENELTALAILHGHIGSSSMGPRRPRTWVSAGDRDRVRTVAYMTSVAQQLRREQFPEADLRVFQSGHSLEDAELTALVAWWLR